ncbi:MAG: polyribonucleotide nucleotidyltransferase [Vulcanimicrobiota bacterium]
MSKTATLEKTEKVVVEKEIGGRILRMETGELAKQAGGAVLLTYGETVVLVTATTNPEPRPGASFFPLTVDYDEKMYAAGKIPGGWIKREGRPPERVTLTCRLIDRPIRPLFPDGFRNDVHVVGMALSVDEENNPDVIALSGAGAALSLSECPFLGPVAGVRVGYVDGEFLINPTESQLETSQLDLIVAGTRDSIMMVECGAMEVSEDLLLDAFEEAHDAIRDIIEMIDEMVEKVGKEKKEYFLFLPNEKLKALMEEHLAADVAKAIRIADKAERSEAFSKINRESMIALVQKLKFKEKDEILELLANDESPDFNDVLKEMKGSAMVNMIIDDKVRIDGRTTTEIRKLDAKVGMIPRTHGSGLFTRGQTQVLSLVTLGTLAEEQTFDNIIGETSRRYIHHYNFPPFSVGEARFMRGPGRREIGHGALAERALAPVIPSEEEFPYTLRVVSECLESNGSTSMASTCGSTLSLMDAGVPIKAPVGGIAMGLVARGDEYAVLTDIQGLEDHLGEMDFKVTGTRDGVTALQMDIKLKGITVDILRTALQQAKDARMTIIDVIEDCIPAPREHLSKHAPRITSIMIDPEKIKDIIGPGGKNINRIIAETGVKIDIENDGRVFIAAVKPDAVDRAIKMVEDQLKDVEAGEQYTGKVMRLMNFGAFVEILPGKEGLLHISKVKPFHVEKIEDVINVGDEVEVKVEEIDSMGRINLTRKGLFSEEEMAEAETKKGSGERGERGGRGGRDRDRGDRDRGGRDRGGRDRDRGDRDRGGRDRDRGRDHGDRDRDRGDRERADRDKPRERDDNGDRGDQNQRQRRPRSEGSDSKSSDKGRRTSSRSSDSEDGDKPRRRALRQRRPRTETRDDD